MKPYFPSAGCCRYSRAYALLWLFCPGKRVSPSRSSGANASAQSELGTTYSIDMSNNAYVTNVLHRGLIMSRHVSPSLRRALRTGPTLSRTNPRYHDVGEPAGKAFCRSPATWKKARRQGHCGSFNDSAL